MKLILKIFKYFFFSKCENEPGLIFVVFQPFFVERAFRIFDRDGNGTVSMAEFIDTMHQFAGQSSDEKLVFLFKVYDLDGKRAENTGV